MTMPKTEREWDWYLDRERPHHDDTPVYYSIPCQCGGKVLVDHKVCAACEVAETCACGKWKDRRAGICDDCNDILRTEPE